MKLAGKIKITYGIAGIGDAALYTFVGTFLLFFLSTVVGIAPGIAGAIAAIGAAWETICGAVIGYVSDGVDTRFGKRKPFLLIAAFPLALFVSLLFTYIDADETVRVFYYTAMILLFWTAFSVFFVPYLAWGAELTQDYDERTVLRGYAFFFNTMGAAVGVVLPTIFVDTLMRWGSSSAQSWQYTGIFCGVLSGLTIFLAAMGTKDRFELAYLKKKAEGSLKAKKKKRGSFKRIMPALLDMLKNYRDILKLRTIRFILGASILFLLGNSIFSANRMYFFTYNMGLSAGWITFMMAFMTFASVAFLPLIALVNKRLDKRYTFLLGLGICAFVMTVLGILGIHAMMQLVIFASAYCIANVLYWQLMPAMIYDVCEVDQLINNKERAGLVISLQSLSESLANAAGLQLLGLILQLAHFDGESKVQNATTLFWTGLSFSIVPAFFMVLAMVMIFKYPITKKMYNRILDALECRKKGEEIDMKPFEKLR